MRGQTNFIRSIWRFNSVFDPRIQMADHARPLKYELRLPEPRQRAAYIHAPIGRSKRALDARTESFVEATRVPAA
jgi:hypothetical protein